MDAEELMFRPGILRGERILVSGGGTGLGREMAEAFLVLGAQVYICGRRGDVLAAAAAELTARHGGSVTPLARDIRDADAVEAMFDAIWADGPLTALVNNAAGNFLSRTEDLSPRGFDAIANIVFRGGFLMTAACGRRWISGGDRGAVLSVLASWIGGGVPYTIPSAMSKAGIEMMTRSLALEWAPKGIRLNALAPGAFPTAGTQAHLRVGAEPLEPGGPNDANAMRRNGRMSELANLAVFLVAPGSEYVNGQTVIIDGGDHLRYNSRGDERRDWTDEDWQQTRDAVRRHDRTERPV
ncbi:SDR family oxidoreductase [Microbacterium sp. LWS13-1.2]|uniref:SDR family oxidoreductase n=1 Tax=Microbacterium sp. LWS13-1.2 TaxID=3135264 RepID=A0AAU6SBT1_9MICO